MRLILLYILINGTEIANRLQLKNILTVLIVYLTTCSLGKQSITKLRKLALLSNNKKARDNSKFMR